VPRKRSHKHAHPDKKNGLPEESTVSSGQPKSPSGHPREPSGQPVTPSGRFTQKDLKKRGKRAEKYFLNNFQSTHVYNIDILIQLAFQKISQDIIES
jgi:hypothetical protein